MTSSKRITLMCGLPGCGKSTWLRKKQHPSPPVPELAGFIVLCPDDFRLVLTGKEFYRPAEDMVWSHVKTTARVLVRNHSIWIDSTNLTIGNRAQWVQIANDLSCDIECVAFNIPLEECLKRNMNRSRIVPEDVLKRMSESLVLPTWEEGFTRITRVDVDGRVEVYNQKEYVGDRN